MSNELTLNQKNREALFQDYQKAANKAQTDLTYQSDLSAAILAPTVFLVNFSSFEKTFDAIIYHLDQAYIKCASSIEKHRISRTAEELFHLHTFVLEQKIISIQEQNQKNFIQKVVGFFRKTPAFLAYQNYVAIGMAATELLVAYVEKLLLDWEIKKSEKYYYLQLGKVFQKILHSVAYDRTLSLVRNTFSTTKKRLLPFVFQEKGLAATINLTAFDETQSEKQDSARIITNALIKQQDWEAIDDLVQYVKKQNLSSSSEIRRNLEKGYGRNLEEAAEKSNVGGMAGGIGCFFSFLAGIPATFIVMLNNFSLSSVAKGLGAGVVFGFGTLIVVTVLILAAARVNLWIKKSRFKAKLTL